MQGDNSAGCSALTVALSHFPADEPHLQAEMLLRPELALHCVALGQLEEASRQVNRCDEILASGEDWLGFAGHAAHAAAVVAASEGEYFVANQRFDAAVNVFERFSLVWDQADVLRSWGRALVAIGEMNQAVDKFDAAIEIYRRHGAGQRWIDYIVVKRNRAATTEQRQQVTEPHQLAIFRRHGDYWTISFDGTDFNLKDAKGLHYIAHLLGNPGEEIAAMDLAALDAGVPLDTSRRTINLGDAGEVLDARARAEYQRRLAELRDEIERLSRMNDIGATEKARVEYEALTAQLAAAAGLGGRPRHSASHRERARVAVTRSIRAAIANIRRSNPSFSRHLAKTVRTGHFCCYVQAEPTPDWQL
jgi:tetratricopeptide (TPR) repeat protein